MKNIETDGRSTRKARGVGTGLSNTSPKTSRGFGYLPSSSSSLRLRLRLRLLSPLEREVLRLDRAFRSRFDSVLWVEDERDDEVRCRSERRVRVEREEREREERSLENVE